MTLLGRLYRGETHFDFVGPRRRWFTISAVLLVVSVGALLWRGLNRSVDFVGGTVVEVGNRAGASVADVRDALAAVGQEDARVQVTGGGAGVRVQTEELDFEAETRLVATVAATAGVQPDDASVQSVGPTFGSQVTESAVRALIFFLIVIAIFISWRLEWKMAVAALAALSHDLVITAGIYSLLGFEVTPATVIAVLTILGYSLYDTVVVFDKVLENVEERSEKDTYTNIVNLSMNQVLMRSVNTSLTSL
ncbi:MAG: protein translocase subunit SecF, partial [Acidimicrobiia bacterium]